MFKSLIILSLIQNLIIFYLKSTDFCLQKQQQCKGFYDKHENYHMKCDDESIKCHDEYNIFYITFNS